MSVDELMAECGASGATIRRDLDVLELHGVLRRVHGGARSLVLRGENPEYGQRPTRGPQRQGTDWEPASPPC